MLTPKIARQQAGLTLCQAAELLHVGRRSLWRYEAPKGCRCPPALVLARMGDVYQLGAGERLALLEWYRARR